MFTKLRCLLSLSLFLSVTATMAVPAPRPVSDNTALMKKAEKLQKDGNYKDAYDIFKKLCLDKTYTDHAAGDALKKAARCLYNINRINEVDELLDRVTAIHADDWRLLAAAGDIYYQMLQHRGYIIAGKFSRGYHRGGGRAVNSIERDRVRQLQLYDQARKLALKENNPQQVSEFILFFANAVKHNNQQSWRLQYLTDLTQLPDYDNGYYYSSDIRNAPVDKSGAPIFYSRPASYEQAKNDGERWRALLAEAERINPKLSSEIKSIEAGFAYNQFGVQTMAQYNWFFRSTTTDSDTRDAAFSLDTLADNETMAKLATGIKRFSLPPEWNYISIYRELAANDYTPETCLTRLAGIFENRRQYDKALKLWQQSLEKFGDSKNHHKQKRIDQISGNWGVFEESSTYPAGKKAAVEFRFRNGSEVSFTAQKVDTQKLLNDIKAYLKENPRKLDYRFMNISNIGYRLIRQDGDKYIGKTVAEWTEKLSPLKNHFDKRITITTPLTKPGAYLLTSKMADGNTGNIVIWISDTVIVNKKLDGKQYYFVADAVSGKPIPNATVEFFNYRIEYIRNSGRLPGSRHQNVSTVDFAEKTNANGEVIPDLGKDAGKYQWLIIATTPADNSAPDHASFKRFAYLGFSSIWNKRSHDQEYMATKSFFITDRPVYRPDQTVKYKLWIRHAQYDKEDISQFADKEFTLLLFNPKNEKMLEKKVKTDSYGGFDGELALADDAPLGTYRIQVKGISGQETFRVEEYKKPEFEVTIDSPDKPIMLGEKITAKVKADYYFGAPVTDAKVKIKITRSNHNSSWYPVAPWDWFYGNGYWWFGYNYNWYPGWAKWGCMRPAVCVPLAGGGRQITSRRKLLQNPSSRSVQMEPSQLLLILRRQRLCTAMWITATLSLLK